MLVERQTKYTMAVKDYLRIAGHATNQQIINYLHVMYPEVSATTVHRITSRLVTRKEIAFGPVSKDNYLRFDFNTGPHDHFQCLLCDRLRDLTLPRSMIKSIQNLAGDCQISGRLIIQGTCNKCLLFKEEL